MNMAKKNKHGNVVQPVMYSTLVTFGLCKCKACSFDYEKKDVLNISGVGAVCLNCVHDLVRRELE